jgi:hypothetical protein
MNTFYKLTATLAAPILLGAIVQSAWAEKREQTCVKTNYRTMAKSTMPVTTPPNLEIAQEAAVSTIKFSNPEFKVTEEWNYNQSIGVDGTGDHHGFWVDFHSTGEQTYGDYQGSYKTTSNADGTWLTTWQGTFKYLGGTGKYKNIKGSGTYKGKVGSKEEFREECKETVDY